MSLNSEQRSAVEWILRRVLESSTLARITLVGEGGTGKTYSIMDAAQRLIDAGLKVIFTAPTNKAVKQLEKAAREYGLATHNCAFQTTHSALGLTLLPNEDRKHVVRAGKAVAELFDVMIVDEGSMLSRYALYDHLLPVCDGAGVHLIGMGDDLQLPPVKEPVSPIFTEFEQFRLTVNMRQQPGELLTVNGLLRTAMRGNQPFKAPQVEGNQIIEIKDAQFLKAVLAAFDHDTDLDLQRVLAWTNRRVDAVNAAIRKKLYGAEAAPYVEGERVVTGAPVKGPEDSILLGTDEECIVHHVDLDSTVTEDITGNTWRTVRLVLDPIYLEDQVVVEVLHADEQDRYQAMLSGMADHARENKTHARQLWYRFWQFKEMFAHIRYCYCITVHRSQGSTYDRVFVDVKDILRNANRIERQRLLYVASSRPRHELLINKSRYVA